MKIDSLVDLSKGLKTANTQINCPIYEVKNYLKEIFLIKILS